MAEINEISDYIQKITELIAERNANGDKIVVYRGEPRIHDIPGKPGIFRERHIKRQPFFERNLLNEMKVNKITSGNTFLECEVDAQHDEFPSRLLDVTYNALIALYFAVTPYYKRYTEDAYDDKYDGQVIVYFLPHIYCAGSENIENIFNKIINRNEAYLTHPLVQENYKLVNHIKMNTRICVQQGAFIMFQGDEYTPISKKDYEVIKINKNVRGKLRKELDILFGINTGFVYPEPFNLFSAMGNKAYRIVNTETSVLTELDDFLKRIIGELDYYFEQSLKLSSDSKLSKEEIKKKVIDIVMKTEELLFKYKIELNDFLKKYNDKIKKKGGEEIVDKYITKFNEIICEYDSMFSIFENKYGITKSCKELMM